MDSEQVKKDAKSVAQDAKAVAKDAKAVAAAKAEEVGVTDKINALLEFIRKNPALAAKVGAAMLPILLGLFKKKASK